MIVQLNPKSKEFIKCRLENISMGLKNYYPLELRVSKNRNKE